MADLIKTLASHMVSRKRAGSEPYVLVLGAGASLSSGCSSYAKLVDDFLQQYCTEDLPALNEEQDARTREEAKRERFYAEWRHMSGVNRYAFLRPHLMGDPSPGYGHLAALVHQGYFRLIFSTNLDNHVERAFTDAGLAPNQDYEPLTNGPGKEAEITRRLEAPTPPVKLVKLHGTLSDEDSYAWLPEEVFAFEDELGDALRTHLNADAIILGHRMDDRDLNLPFRARGGEIWFVNPAGARDTDFKAVLDVRAQSRTLTGDAARFDDFLAALRTQIEAVESGTLAAAEEPAIHRFLREIGLPGQINESRSRYLHLPELYVKPEEYDRIRAILAEHHAVVIAGEPHMGKTYTALHLLWERFQQGWNVVHMRRDALADELRRCSYSIDEFASRHLTKKCLLHLDDPFGETEYQPLGPLQKDLARLVHEVRRRGDCALILTSRIGIFNEAMGHLEGAALFREMGVEADIRVHTSYSENTRREVLKRYLNIYKPPWAAEEALRRRALAQVPGILEAPHNLELFARRSESLSEEGELLDFARSCRQLVPALAEWIGRLPAEDQLVLLLARSFACTGEIAELRAIHRKALGQAYEKGLVEHIPSTAWDSALDRLREIITIIQKTNPGPTLSFVHPSYAEALSHALGESPRLRALWVAAAVVASNDPRPEWRIAAAHLLVRDYEKLDPEGRHVLASLAADQTHHVRGQVANALAVHYQQLGEEDCGLLAQLAADEAVDVRTVVAGSLMGSYEKLDATAKGWLASLGADQEDRVRSRLARSLGRNYTRLDATARQLLQSLAADPAEGVRSALASSVAVSYASLDGPGRELLASLAADARGSVRASLARSLAANHVILDRPGRELLASLAGDAESTVRGTLGGWLASTYETLGAPCRRLLVSLAADEDAQVRTTVARALARTYDKLDGEGRRLLGPLAIDEDIQVGRSLARRLAHRYDRLDAQGRALLAPLAAHKDARVRTLMARSLARKHDKLDAKGRKLLASLAADEAKRVRATVAFGLACNYAHLDEEGRKLLDQVRASLHDH